jgi:hypothetical protein
LIAEISFIPVVVQCVEKAAVLFGMGWEESLKLALATEEIFAYLRSNVCRGDLLDIRCVNRISYVRVEFRFPVSVLDMGALNIAANVDYNHEDDVTKMGLAIASRSIERLNIVAEGKNRICLTIEKDKVYPEVPAASAAPVAVQGALKVDVPDPEGVKRYVTILA